MDIRGKTALITGGKRIGAAVAVRLAELGADVALAYHSSKREADDTALAVRGLGRRAVVTETDLQVPSQCTSLVEGTVAALGRLDVLVNMASLYSSKPVGV